MDIIGKRKITLWISALMVAAGVAALLVWGLRLSIDFAGGALFEISGTKDTVLVAKVAEEDKLENVTVVNSGSYLTMKTKEMPDATHRKFTEDLSKKIPGARESRFESVGPSVSKSITKNAFYSVVLASAFIILYLTYAFRKVKKPLNSWEFGVMAIVALVHDVLFVLGIFAILGHFFNLEVDSMFVTAILTIIGFSVHDTIVVYDRIRERVVKEGVGDFEYLVNHSILETFARSINTSLTVVLTLLVLLLFGGVTIKTFVLALLLGIITGTYSSIFVASALLVESFNFKKRLKKA